MVGQEALYSVAKTLQADAEGVPGLGFFCAKSAIVELFGFFIAFEREAFSREAADGNQAGALFQVALKMGPVFFAELFSYAKSGFRFLFFFGVERGEQLSLECVAFGGQTLDPTLRYLGVAEGAEAAEEFASHLTHLGPSGVGVDLFHDCGERAATADGDT